MKGTIIASCGHELVDGDEGREVITWGEDCDAVDGFHPCTFHNWYCTPCADKAREWEEYLPDQAAADAWLTQASEAHHAKKRARQ